MAEKQMSAGGYRVQNPATGEVLETFERATDQQIQDVLAQAEAGYREWSAQTIEQRGQIVQKVADLFDERKEKLAKIITEEMGKPHSEGVEEAEFSAEIFGYFVKNGPTLGADQQIESFSGGRAYVQKRPIGALLGIMPWNFPYYQIARFAAPNLMLGNTIILKHAEICPRSALAVQKIMDDAGVPAGVYTNVFASHDQIAEIIADPRVQGVSLTGSERAGSAIGALAGKHLKKAVLELGGSDPYIILDADDVKGAARTAWETRIYNTGQVCNANKRLIVMEDIYDEFLAELKDLATGMQPGESIDVEAKTYTPMSSRTAAEDLHEQVQRAVSQGAEVIAGGGLVDESSAYYAPAVLTGVTSEMDAYRQELFGPVATVYKVSSDEEALAVANDTQYGLGGAVFSKDAARAERIAEQLEVGMANVNTPAGEGAEIPFGGVKRSGFGRELGPLGMDEFVNKRMYYVAD